MTLPSRLINARLPRWLLPTDWPENGNEPQLAALILDRGRVKELMSMPALTRSYDTLIGGEAEHSGTWDLRGAPVLPGMVDAHTHLDKTFTQQRVGNVVPGLLGAIQANTVDSRSWTPSDVHMRATRALEWAYQAGCVHVRSHVDWWEPEATPLSWQVLAQLATEWQGRIHLEQVTLINLGFFKHRDRARAYARLVAQTGPHALLGAFVHTTNWDADALQNLLIAAEERGLDVDLHVDEELDPRACGLLTAAHLAREMRFSGQVVCGHSCALAAQPEHVALATLDAVARAPISLLSLPLTNLLLQDATVDRTPRMRGLTLIKEARSRGIPVLFGSDNVQDPFCRLGSYDPIEAMTAGVLAAQLDAPFDQWSDSLCRRDWLRRSDSHRPVPSLVGMPADLVIFKGTDAWGWPSRAGQRIVLRSGIALPDDQLM